MATAPLQAPSSTPQVLVHFSTRTPQIALPTDPGPILVPTNLRRAGLSSIINYLLSNPSSAPTPFDILIGGRFLRTDLETYLTGHGLSAESTLQVEYIRAFSPPVLQSGFQQDDWIGAVKALGIDALGAQGEGVASEILLSASYDGLLRAYDGQGLLLGTSKAIGPAPLQGLKILAPLGNGKVASASMSHDILLYALKSRSSSDATPETVTFKPSLRLEGHRDQITALVPLDPNPATNTLLSTSTSGHIATWDLNAPHVDAESERPSKRRRGSAVTIRAIAPVHIAQAASAPLTTGVLARDGATAYITTPSAFETVSLSTFRSISSRPLPACAVSSVVLQPQGPVALGTTNKSILLVDPRTEQSRAVAGTLRGHTNIVSCLALAPEVGSTLFASGSHDGTVKVWDLRGGTVTGVEEETRGGVKDASVYTVTRRTRRKEDKVFAVDWSRGMGLVSGGNDCFCQVDRFHAPEDSGQS